jgi:prolyl-tRNA editing enzyme YbaK/EbsC (Cys-tRNA(Pro) deacylase)
MSSTVSSSTERVKSALQAQGLEPEIKQFDASTRTAQQAADAIGTSVAQIVKSLAFAAGEGTVIVLASGSNRVDTERLAKLAGTSIGRADPDRVRHATSFAIGGVPPLGYPRPLPVYVDRDLLQFDEVWAAAGTPNAVFRISPADLVRVSGGTVADVREA